MSANDRYHQLLSPGTIGAVKTRNRIIKSGSGLVMVHQDDLHMREEMLALYEAMARGGVGLIVTEAPAIDYPWGTRLRRRCRIDDDKYIEAQKELVEVIHRHNCPTFMQMNHDGPWQTNLDPDPTYEGPPVAASAVVIKNKNDFHNEMTKALTIHEIEEIIDKFGKAAERAGKAGYDGVDINAGSTHLFHSFFSPLFNKREDIYGGSIENRARILVQTIQEIKRRMGTSFPVSIIINGLEIGSAAGFDNASCLTPADSLAMAVLFEKAGADAVQVRSHVLGWHAGGFLPDALFYPEAPIDAFPKEYNASLKGVGANVTLAAAVKKKLSVPVTAVGRLDADLGEKLLSEGAADFIAMTRRLLADPHYVNKLAAGHPDGIAPCTGCNTCLGSGRCRINGLLGTPYNRIEEAERKKRILVIGGGPAGMEAARVSALRGHDVVLYEKESKLGGLLPLAAMVKGPHPEDLVQLVNYLEHEVGRLGVKTNLGKEADLSVIDKERPDAVFLASGGLPTLPEIPGIDGPNVVSGAELHKKLKFFSRFIDPYSLRKLSKVRMPIGKRVVVIGSAIQGCELAEFLTKRGRKVTIVDKAEQMGEGMVAVFLAHLTAWFERKGVVVINGVKEYVEITKKGLVILTKEGKRETLAADTIVPALPMIADGNLFDELKKRVAEVYAVGDCLQPGLIVDAIGTAIRTARSV
jgi:2,4-dienoyl-CoA reductase (NADPH2)